MIKIRDKIEEPSTTGGVSLPIDAVDVNYDNGTSRLTATAVQDALDELAARPRAIGTSFEKITDVLSTPFTSVPVAVPFSGSILSWQINGNVSGSAVIEVKKNGTTISASAHPTVSGGSTASSSSLTGWTTTFVAGDVFTFYLSSAVSFNQLALLLYCEET